MQEFNLPISLCRETLRDATACIRPRGQSALVDRLPDSADRAGYRSNSLSRCGSTRLVETIAKWALTGLAFGIEVVSSNTYRSGPFARHNGRLTWSS